MIKTIGNRIQKLRESILEGKKITQEEFSKKIGISQAALSFIEDGLRNPSLQTILLIDLIYGVRKEWLQTGKGDIFKGKILKFQRKDDMIEDERYYEAADILKDIFIAKDEGVIGAIYSNLLQFKRIPSGEELAHKKRSTPGKSSGAPGSRQGNP